MISSLRSVTSTSPRSEPAQTTVHKHFIFTAVYWESPQGNLQSAFYRHERISGGEGDKRRGLLSQSASLSLLGSLFTLCSFHNKTYPLSFLSAATDLLQNSLFFPLNPKTLTVSLSLCDKEAELVCGAVTQWKKWTLQCGLRWCRIMKMYWRVRWKANFI